MKDIKEKINEWKIYEENEQYEQYEENELKMKLHNENAYQYDDMLGKLEAYSKENIVPMHMPGAKRNSELIGRYMDDMPAPYDIDITEIDGFDNMHNADGMIKKAFEKTAALYGADESLFLGGCVAAAVAWLIGLPVLRLKSDYLAIATLGFAEIIRAIFQWDPLGPVTNGANALKNFPTFSSFNIQNADGKVILRLSTFVPFLLAGVCVAVIVLLINSTYGRAFKAIRDDEVAAEAMGINLARHKRLAFCISSFFAGVGGGLFAMFANQAQAKVFTTAMTYEILLIVVIGGIGSISGSCIAAFLYVAASEWWLRFLDAETYIGSFKVPFLRTGFRMVVFSVIIMVVVLFFRKGIMGDKELPDLLKKRQKKAKKEAVQP